MLEVEDPADENHDEDKAEDVIEVTDTPINRAGPPVQSERSSDESVQIIDVAGQA